MIPAEWQTPERYRGLLTNARAKFARSSRRHPPCRPEKLDRLRGGSLFVAARTHDRRSQAEGTGRRHADGTSLGMDEHSSNGAGVRGSALTEQLERLDDEMRGLEIAVRRGHPKGKRRPYRPQALRRIHTRQENAGRKRADALAKITALPENAPPTYRRYLEHVRAVAAALDRPTATVRARMMDLVDQLDRDVDAMLTSGFCARAAALEQLLIEEDGPPGQRLIDLDKVACRAMQTVRGLREYVEETPEDLSTAIRHFGIRQKTDADRQSEAWLRGQLATLGGV